MAKATKSKKKPIDQYDHKGKKRVNNPPVGLVTPQTDKETGKKKYAYDTHIDPALQFDFQRSQVEKIIDNGLSGETVEEVKAALWELKSDRSRISIGEEKRNTLPSKSRPFLFTSTSGSILGRLSRQSAEGTGKASRSKGRFSS